MINTVIFDFGGVLLTNDWDHDYHDFFTDLKKELGVDEDALETGWKSGHHDFFTGRITEDDFWKRFLVVSGSKKGIEKAKTIWRKHQKINQDVKNIIKKLKKNYRIAGLTNLSVEWTSFKTVKFGLDSIFEIVLSSGDAGFLKPDKKIYEIMLERLGVNPQECVFVDDKERNVEGAKKLGMHGVLFTNVDNLKKELNELFVDV